MNLKYNLITINLLLFLIICSLNRIVCNEDVVSVRINEGVINGKIETSVDNKKINVFRGIPYAEPPVGERRFKRPVPLRQWPNTLDAFQWPNTCVQSVTDPSMDAGFYNKNASEDCLYLNILSPIDSLKSDKLLPVIFYIHGGGLFMGTSGWLFNDMSVLTAKGDVVTVSVNYRLGALGFLYSGTDEAPGNVGLLDQALALEWISDNIKYFGGDPNEITIMGLSAGGWSVSLHLLSPITRNLYKNAIFQSGAYDNHMIDGEYHDQIAMWLKGAELVDCNEDKVSDEFTPEIMECLRNADADSLIGIGDNPKMSSRSISFLPLVVTDGTFLPKKPTEMLESGDFKQNSNILFSTAVDEGSMFLGMKQGPLLFKNITYEEAYEELKEMSSKFSVKHKINGEDVANVYLSGLKGTADSDLLKRTIGIAIGDFILGCPPILFAKEMFRNSGFKTNVYQYYWNRKVESKKAIFPGLPFAGPSHGGDAEPTHGLPFLNPDNYPDVERERSQQMIDFIISFVKTGTPITESGTEWPRYFAIDDNIIAPFYEITSSPKSDTNFGIGLKINECEYLWRKYLV